MSISLPKMSKKTWYGQMIPGLCYFAIAAMTSPDAVEESVRTLLGPFGDGWVAAVPFVALVFAFIVGGFSGHVVFRVVEVLARSGLRWLNKPSPGAFFQRYPSMSYSKSELERVFGAGWHGDGKDTFDECKDRLVNENPEIKREARSREANVGFFLAMFPVLVVAAVVAFAAGQRVLVAVLSVGALVFGWGYVHIVRYSEPALIYRQFIVRFTRDGHGHIVPRP